MPDNLDKLDVLLKIYTKQFDDLKDIFQKHEIDVDQRFRTLEQKVVDLQIKGAESGTKMAVMWSIFATAMCAIIGLAVGVLKK